MDKLRAIDSFVRIVEQGSLTAAANDAGVSLASMVRTLAALERELGVTLLNRTTRRIHLTDSGRRYLVRCRAILASVHDADLELQSHHAAPLGRLVISASVLLGQRCVAPVVLEFLRRHPGVQPDLLFLDRCVNLVEEGVDVAIRIGRLADSSLVAVRLGEVRRVVCASPAYLREHGIPQRPTDIAEHRCIQFSGLAPRAEWDFRVGGKTVAIAIPIALACNQAQLAIDACVAGTGLGTFLSYMVAPLHRAGALAFVLEQHELPPLPVNFLFPHTRLLSPTVRAFADFCVERITQATFDEGHLCGTA